MNKSEYPLEIRTHTALHILKGAVVKVLGEDAMWTAGTYTDNRHGRLTVKFNRRPSDEEVKMIEEQANKKIEEDAEIHVMELDRVEAEEKIGKIIYDLYPVPDNVKKLKIVYIKDWNINACNKDHTLKTGDVGGIAIHRVRFRKSKKLLEIVFDII